MTEHHHEHICWGAPHAHRNHHTLEVTELSAGYGQRTVLTGISFREHCSTTLAFIGPNGAGKSTLLNILAGLKRAETGSILWNGTPLHRSRHEIAYMPQRTEVDWNFPITVRKLVSMGRYQATGLWRSESKHDREIIDKALETLNLQHLQGRQISELSGGQQQRSFLARALAQEAHILLLDEPFTGLDVPGAEKLSQLLRQLAAEGRLIIASHHDLATAPKIFDKALLLKGRTVAYGPTTEVLTPDNLQRAFGLTTPTTGV